MDAIEDLRQLEEINRQLIEANLKLIEQVEMLTHNLASLQDNQSHEICIYFLEYKSIHDTAKEYYFNCDLDCYYALVEYFGCSDPLTTATDYKNVLMGQEEGIDDEIDVNTHI